MSMSMVITIKTHDDPPMRPFINEGTGMLAGGSIRQIGPFVIEKPAG